MRMRFADIEIKWRMALLCHMPDTGIVMAIPICLTNTCTCAATVALVSGFLQHGAAPHTYTAREKPGTQATATVGS